jgi:hypothetical protein
VGAAWDWRRGKRHGRLRIVGDLWVLSPPVRPHTHRGHTPWWEEERARGKAGRREGTGHTPRWEASARVQRGSARGTVCEQPCLAHHRVPSSPISVTVSHMAASPSAPAQRNLPVHPCASHTRLLEWQPKLTLAMHWARLEVCLSRVALQMLLAPVVPLAWNGMRPRTALRRG